MMKYQMARIGRKGDLSNKNFTVLGDRNLIERFADENKGGKVVRTMAGQFLIQCCKIL